MFCAVNCVDVAICSPTLGLIFYIFISLHSYWFLCSQPHWHISTICTIRTGLEWESNHQHLYCCIITIMCPLRPCIIMICKCFLTGPQCVPKWCLQNAVGKCASQDPRDTAKELITADVKGLGKTSDRILHWMEVSCFLLSLTNYWRAKETKTYSKYFKWKMLNDWYLNPITYIFLHRQMNSVK